MKKITYSDRWIDRNCIQDLFALWDQRRIVYDLFGAKIIEQKRSSGLGLFAPFISMLVHVLVLGFVMSLVFGENVKDFIPFFSISLCVWQGISYIISEAAHANERAVGYLFFPSLSSFLVHAIGIIDFFLSLLLKLISAFVIVLIFNYHILYNVNWFSLSIGVFLLTGAIFFWQMPLAIFFDKFRILKSFVGQFLLLLSLVTPIFWMPDRLREHKWIVELNPVFHLIEVVRSPFLNGTFRWQSVFAVIFFLVSGFVLSCVVYKYNKKYIVYRWVA